MCPAQFLSDYPFCRGEPWTGGGPLPPDKHAKDAQFLDNYAQERWEVSQN